MRCCGEPVGIARSSSVWITRLPALTRPRADGCAFAFALSHSARTPRPSAHSVRALESASGSDPSASIVWRVGGGGRTLRL